MQVFDIPVQAKGKVSPNFIKTFKPVINAAKFNPALVIDLLNTYNLVRFAQRFKYAAIKADMAQPRFRIVVFLCVYIAGKNKFHCSKAGD